MEPGGAHLHVTNVITGIRPHGAELALLRLVQSTRDRCDHRVIVLSSADDLRPEFESAGAEVVTVGLGGGLPNPFRLLELARAIRRGHPHLVQTWLPAADLLGGLVTRLSSRVPVIWNLRHSDHQPGRWGWPTRLAVRVNARTSRVVPTRIIAVAERAASAHAQIGYDRSRMRVIHNGFEVPDPIDASARRAARDEIGLPDDAIVVCRLGRLHPDKDFPSLFAAWAEVVARHAGVVLVLAGSGLDAANEELTSMIRTADVEGSVRCLGELSDPSALYAASDLTVSSSLAEGLPNVIGEAMARGIPAVATDAGDSAVLVGETGRVVPSGRPDLLAMALIEVIDLPTDERRALGEQARNRIIERFSMQAMAEAYISEWTAVARERKGR